MGYQGVARNSDGQTLMNDDLDIRISLISSVDIHNAVYVEKHTVRTNSFGLFNLRIGSGEVVSGSMEEVHWSQSDHFIMSELDLDQDGVYMMMGTSQLVSVPYAFYAEHAGTSDSSFSSRTIPFTGVNGQTIHHNGTDWAATSQLYNDGAFIGIGNTSPSHALDIDGDINLSTGGALRVNDSKVLDVPGTSNVHLGVDAGSVSTGSFNVFLGDESGGTNSTGSYNMFLGYRSGRSNTIGSRNLKIGYGAGLFY